MFLYTFLKVFISGSQQLFNTKNRFYIPEVRFPHYYFFKSSVRQNYHLYYFYNTFCIVSFYEVFFEIRIFRILIRLTSEYFSPHGFPSLRALTSKMITFQSDHKYNLMIFFLLKVNIQDILYRCYVPGLSCRKLDSCY